MCRWNGVTESPLDGFEQYVAYRLSGQAFTFPCSLGGDLTIATVFGKRGSDGRVAFDFKASGAPALITVCHSVMFAAGVPVLGAVVRAAAISQ